MSLNGERIAKTPFAFGGILTDCGKILLAQSNDAVDFFDLSLGAITQTIECDMESVGNIRCFSPETKLLAMEAGNRLTLFSLESESIARTLEVPEDAEWFEADKELSSVRFAKNGSTLIAINRRGNVFVWDTLTGHRKLETSLSIPKNKRRLDDAISIASHRNLAAIGSDHNIDVLDFDSGVIKKMDGHTAAISSVEFSPDGSRIASMDWNGTLRIWDSVDLQELIAFKNKCAHGKARFSSSGRQIVSTDKDGYFEFYGDISQLRDKACSPNILSLTQSILEEDPRVPRRPVDIQLMIAKSNWTTVLNPIEKQFDASNITAETKVHVPIDLVESPDIKQMNKDSFQIAIELRCRYFDQAAEEANRLIKE